MANKEPKSWITIKGRHIPIFEGETKADAIKRLKENTKKGPEPKKATVKKQEKKPEPIKSQPKEKVADKNSVEYRTQRVKDALKYAKEKIDKESYSWNETVLDAQYEYNIPRQDVPHLEKAMKLYAMKKGKFQDLHGEWDKKFREQGVNAEQLLNKDKKLEKVHEADDLLKDYKGYTQDKKLQETEKYLKDNREQYEANKTAWRDRQKELDKARDKYIDKDMLEILTRDEARFLVNDKDHPEIMAIKEKADKQYADMKEYEKVRDEYYDAVEQLDKKQSRIERNEYGLPDFKKAVGEYQGFYKDKTDVPYYDDLIKEGKANIVEMTPEEYIKECAYYVFEGSTLEKTLRGRVGDADTEKYAKMMREGTKFYTPYLNYEDYGQEGLHRAVAAYINGIKKIPVVIVGSRR